MLYVSLTRTRKQEYVNFGDISIVKPYRGSVHRVSFNGKSYIGSAKDVKERWAAHKQGNDTAISSEHYKTTDTKHLNGKCLKQSHIVI